MCIDVCSFTALSGNLCTKLGKHLPVLNAIDFFYFTHLCRFCINP